MEEVRRCLWCDKVLVRKEGETAGNYRKRVTCDKSCAAFRGNKLRGLRKGQKQG